MIAGGTVGRCREFKSRAADRVSDLTRIAPIEAWAAPYRLARRRVSVVAA